MIHYVTPLPLQCRGKVFAKENRHKKDTIITLDNILKIIHIAFEDFYALQNLNTAKKSRLVFSTYVDILLSLDVLMPSGPIRELIRRSCASDIRLFKLFSICCSILSSSTPSSNKLQT